MKITSYILICNKKKNSSRGNVRTISSPVGQKQSSSLQTFHVGQDLGCLDTQIKTNNLKCIHPQHHKG